MMEIAYRRIFLGVLIFTLLSISERGETATYTSTSNGDWSSASTWSIDPTNSCSTGGNNTFIIATAVTSNCNPLSFSGNVTIHIISPGSFTVTGSGGITGSVTLIVDYGASMSVSGDLNLSGSSSVSIDCNRCVTCCSATSAIAQLHSIKISGFESYRLLFTSVQLPRKSELDAM